MAGTDVFGYKRNPKPDGVFSSEDSSLTIGGTSMTSSAYLVQSWNVEYTQDVAELFEIGSNRLYWAKGRPVGRGSVGRVVGANKADMPGTGLFPKEAYDICDGGGTFLGIASLLKQAVPSSPLGLYVTHGIFSKGLEVFNGLIDGVYTANPFPQVDLTNTILTVI